MIMKKLPDAEFEVMQAIWQFNPPVTSNMLIEVLERDSGKVWKPQTVHTLLGRLSDKGFLRSEKDGKERLFSPLVGRDEYLQFETQSFVRQYHGGNRLNLINALYQGETLSRDDVEELMEWMNRRRNKK
jgi:BlaI family penicillinase repressor